MFGLDAYMHTYLANMLQPKLKLFKWYIFYLFIGNVSGSLYAGFRNFEES